MVTETKNILNSSQTRLNLMSDEMLTDSLVQVSIREREVVGDVVTHICEFMRRRLFLSHGCASIFDYLTKKLAYSNSAAQCRIDAARISARVPAVADDLRSGAVCLSQISVVAQALRQHRREMQTAESVPDSHLREIMYQIRGLDVKTTAVTISRELNLKLKETERTRYQRNESVRLEMTLSKAQFEALRRAKDLSSHINHDANWADLVAFLASEYLKRKDPTVASDRKCETIVPRETAGPKRKAIPISIKRAVAARGWQCEHVDENSGETCASTYQLQFDHVISVCAGGTNDQTNLQVLCGVHNRLKFQRGG